MESNTELRPWARNDVESVINMLTQAEKNFELAALALEEAERIATHRNPVRRTRWMPIAEMGKHAKTMVARAQFYRGKWRETLATMGESK